MSEFKMVYRNSVSLTSILEVFKVYRSNIFIYGQSVATQVVNDLHSSEFITPSLLASS
ncbi:hypothetical protein SAMN05421796_101345 [Chryseobacterium piscicola]|uniref:Uncharacterized protein n=1 Tax=Chryseobacterium piscicola TaxID=551459 RepID=A0A1N7K672_9FLAO|nr:hypothetical protein SAMN05421796_101345 [Chryseobacterium piscicola]